MLKLSLKQLESAVELACNIIYCERGIDSAVEGGESAVYAMGVSVPNTLVRDLIRKKLIDLHRRMDALGIELVPDQDEK